MVFIQAPNQETETAGNMSTNFSQLRYSNNMIASLELKSVY